jgi:cytochrome c peroxidase
MRIRRVAGWALGALAALLPPAGFAAGGVPFTEAEVRAILAHGPWPAPATHDPSNRVSGNRPAIELGEILFFETRLSASGNFACASCHVPERNWTDNRIRGAAAADVDRNTPTLMNVRLGRWFGWAGRRGQLVVAEHPPDSRCARAWREPAACRRARAQR